MASRDFLGRFGGEKGSSSDKAGGGAGEPDEVVELSLGLSLGGCFGANSGRDAKKPRLVRSSSLAAMCSLPGTSDDLAAATPSPAPLMRTSSLPTETEEERWRRREMQSLKRLQAKRKRLERRTSMNSGKSGGSSSRDDAQEPLYPSAFQLRRSVVDQGNTSSSMPEQGIHMLSSASLPLELFATISLQFPLFYCVPLLELFIQLPVLVAKLSAIHAGRCHAELTVVLLVGDAWAEGGSSKSSVLCHGSCFGLVIYWDRFVRTLAEPMLFFFAKFIRNGEFFSAQPDDTSTYAWDLLCSFRGVCFG
ncbi:unnamed protein product [Triticum turgidum subsp. durum]|uniref:Ninja-family protein n=1 Tax=Triticum turgidum subsp. durum TaxID=4567 RepID=A0A9R1PII1_TRITD|nr:unnamed protein product [Triticum turgidum subsp. durum]